MVERCPGEIQASREHQVSWALELDPEHGLHRLLQSFGIQQSETEGLEAREVKFYPAEKTAHCCLCLHLNLCVAPSLLQLGLLPRRRLLHLFQLEGSRAPRWVNSWQRRTASRPCGQRHAAPEMVAHAACDQMLQREEFLQMGDQMHRCWGLGNQPVNPMIVLVALVTVVDVLGGTAAVAVDGVAVELGLDLGRTIVGTAGTRCNSRSCLACPADSGTVAFAASVVVVVAAAKVLEAAVAGAKGSARHHCHRYCRHS